MRRASLVARSSSRCLKGCSKAGITTSLPVTAVSVCGVIRPSNQRECPLLKTTMRPSRRQDCQDVRPLQCAKRFHPVVLVGCQIRLAIFFFSAATNPVAVGLIARAGKERCRSLVKKATRLRWRTLTELLEAMPKHKHGILQGARNCSECRVGNGFTGDHLAEILRSKPKSVAFLRLFYCQIGYTRGALFHHLSPCLCSRGTNYSRSSMQSLFQVRVPRPFKLPVDASALQIDFESDGQAIILTIADVLWQS